MSLFSNQILQLNLILLIGCEHIIKQKRLNVKVIFETKANATAFRLPASDYLLFGLCVFINF